MNAGQEELGEVLMAALLINKTFMENETNGAISKDKAMKLLKKEMMGNKVKNDEVEKLFNTLDTDGSGALDFEEFMKLVGLTARMFHEMMKA